MKLHLLQVRHLTHDSWATLVTSYYCRLGELLCFVFMFAYLFDLSVYYLFLQYFDTNGWVFWPVKTVSRITYTVLVGT